MKGECDFCYALHAHWDAEMVDKGTHHLKWQFEICDSCRLLLRNVIGPVLHRVDHTSLVAAIVKLMASMGLRYEDLMVPLRELHAAGQPTSEAPDESNK